MLFKVSLFYQKPLQEVINFKGKLNFSLLLFPETHPGTVYVTQSPRGAVKASAPPRGGGGDNDFPTRSIQERGFVPQRHMVSCVKM